MSLSTAPTLITLGELPGLVTPLNEPHLIDGQPLPQLPLETTTTMPEATASLIASSMARSSCSGLPRLMLIMSAPLPIAHPIAAIMLDVSPFSSSPITFPFSSCAPGATPSYFPPEAVVPAMIPATCVPCPSLSFALPEFEKSFSAATFPLSIGCSLSIPVSRTATFTPFPVYPASQNVFAFVNGTLSARVG